MMTVMRRLRACLARHGIPRHRVALRCIDGRIFRHDPQPDDPELETDIGQCPDCSGDGCGDGPNEAVPKPGRSQQWLRDR